MSTGANSYKPHNVSSDTIINVPDHTDFNVISDSVQAKSDREFEDFINSKRQEIIDKGFSPLERGIGQPKAVQFYKQILGASDEVVNILEHGYKPRWSACPPPTSFFNNNKSAELEMDFVRETVQDWLEKGYIKRLDNPATVNSPLSVASKYDVMSGRFIIWLRSYFFHILSLINNMSLK